MARGWISDVDTFYLGGSSSLDLELGRSYLVHIDTFFLRSGFFGDYLPPFFYPHLFADQPGENLNAAHGHFV